jgi:hypothetical protein
MSSDHAVHDAQGRNPTPASFKKGGPLMSALWPGHMRFDLAMALALACLLSLKGLMGLDRHARRPKASDLAHTRVLIAHRSFVEPITLGAQRSRSPSVKSAVADHRAPGAPVSAGPKIPICVRLCDGYFFTLSNAADSLSLGRLETACRKLCPGAPAHLFLMPKGSTKIEDASAPKSGVSYLKIAARLSAASFVAPDSCSCRAPGTDPLETGAILSDATVRPGDTLVTSQGVRIVRRGSRPPFKMSDFVPLTASSGLSSKEREALLEIDQVSKISPDAMEASSPPASHFSTVRQPTRAMILPPFRAR